MYFNNNYNKLYLKIIGVTGDYFRPIVPGSYQIAVEANGYIPAVKPVNVPFKSVIDGNSVILNFKLKREQPQKQDTTILQNANNEQDDSQESEQQVIKKIKL